MPGCAAYGCPNRSNKGFLMKRFPNDPKTRARWAENVRRADWMPTNSSYLCEVHFDANQWEKTREDGSRKLKRSAIPTIFDYSTRNMKRKGSKMLAPVVRNAPVTSCTQALPMLDHSYSSPATREVPKMPAPISGKLEMKGASHVEPAMVEYSHRSPAREVTVPDGPKLTDGITRCQDSSVENGQAVLPSITHELTSRLPSSLLSLASQKFNNKAMLIKHLQGSLNSCYKHIEEQERKLVRLRKALRSFAVQKCRNKKNPARHNLKQIFNEDQISFITNRNNRFHKWSNATISTALGLKFICGKTGYENLLQLNLPYPSLRTLRRRLENFRFESGILYEVFEFLKIKVSFMSELDKECVLLLDEMSLTPSSEGDEAAPSSNFGDITLPDHTGVATHALVFMIAGVSSTWKQTVAFYFTGNSTDGETLKVIVVELITLTENLGLRVSGITCDLSPVKKSMWRSFGIVCGKDSSVSTILHPCDRTHARTIHFRTDAPHLLENIKTMLLKNKTNKPSLQFKYNLKLMCVTQYLKSNSKAEVELLPGFQETSKEKEVENGFEIRLPKEWDRNESCQLTGAEQNCLYIIAGYIVSQVVKQDEVCPACIASVASPTRINLAFTKFVSLQEITEDCLYYAFEHTFSFFIEMEVLFRRLESSIVLLKAQNSKTLIHEKIQLEESFNKHVSFLECHGMQDKLENRFLTFRLKIFAIKKKKKRWVSKLKKEQLENPPVGALLEPQVCQGS